MPWSCQSQPGRRPASACGEVPRSTAVKRGRGTRPALSAAEALSRTVSEASGVSIPIRPPSAWPPMCPCARHLCQRQPVLHFGFGDSRLTDLLNQQRSRSRKPQSQIRQSQVWPLDKRQETVSQSKSRRKQDIGDPEHNRRGAHSAVTAHQASQPRQ